jgi:hypothetical protein
LGCAYALAGSNPPGPIPGAAEFTAAAKHAEPPTLTIVYTSNLWPKVNGVATVYYIIDPASDPNATSKIDEAIGIFNADFPKLIQWVPWTSSDGPNYVDINLSASNSSGQCEANEGYEAIPAQPMTGSTACTLGVVLHEMGHVIGLWHEFQRSDRATYVTVNYANVIKGSWGNFEILTDNEQILGPYDYASVMHYIPYAFSRNGGAVLESIPAGIPMAGYEGVPMQPGATGTPLPGFDYSAGDKESIERLYGAAPTAVTVTSNPIGLSVIVDGVTVTTPQTYAWPLYSSHTLNVSSDVQTLSGAILESDPEVSANFYYTYGRWNNTTAQSQTITVLPGNGSPTFPTTSPQIATYSANFIQLVPYTTTAIYPAGTGTATISPQPQAYSGVTGDFFVARQEATLTATAEAGWNFYGFINSPFWLPGGLGANPKTFYVPDTGTPVDTTAYFSDTPVYTVTAAPNTFSSNLYVTVDSVFEYAPRNFSSYYDSTWTKGSTHTLSVPAVQYPYSGNSRYNFAKWSDGGAMSHSIESLPAKATAYTATLTPEYQPATNFNYPPCGGSGTLSPASPTGDGFYPTGQVLSYSATPDAGWSFAGWTFDVTGTANPAELTAKGETLVFANFNTVATPLTLTDVKPATAKAGGAGVLLTLTGTGFSPQSLVSANGQYRTVTYVSPTKLTVRLNASDVAAAGAFQIFVENFPSGWTGCAVFGYQTFLIEGKGAPAATPVFSPAPGKYTQSQTVSISDALTGATIYYTTDGSNPTTSSPVYSGPISVGATETLKADATATGYVRSAVASAKYTISP